TGSFTSARVTLGGQPINARLDAGQTVTLKQTATVTPDASLTIRLS
ncbi:MAG: hypothetical protein GY953_49460, partial [bacterium]|nr:hypothetical protein [bacterium]